MRHCCAGLTMQTAVKIYHFLSVGSSTTLTVTPQFQLKQSAPPSIEIEIKVSLALIDSPMLTYHSVSIDVRYLMAETFDNRFSSEYVS